ncbi:MAG TPA: MlaD family protein [Solirubrobacteraceae bacterium]|nr:MlaD family protein [Solirubrobacteraceae bacterium]
MRRAIKNHIGDFAAIVALLVLSLAVAGYILTNERLRLPFLSSSQYTLNAAFTTAKAVTPGQGQTVNISGVQVGEIGGVQLKDGVAIVQLKIDSKYRKMIHENATALLRPRTGLEDMFVELQPGAGPSPVAPSGYTIPLSNTMPTIEADEILSSLDADTRAYLDLLVNGAGQGLKNNGGSQLAQVFARFEPTHRDLARLNKAIAQRGANLRQLIHSLNVLNGALAQKQIQITQLVAASAKVFRAFASEDRNVSRAVADLPSTLAQTTATLAKVTTFAHVLGPAAVNLLPAVKAIPAANQAITQLAKPSAPILQQQIRPFVVASRPLVQSLLPVSEDLASATPNLSGTFQVLNHLFNMLGYYPGGGQHGYLWWLAWLDHNARTLFSVQDANGDFRPLFLQFSCQQLSMFFNPPPQLGSFLTTIATSILNLGPSHTACQASGLGTNSGSTGGLPPLPLPKLARDTSTKAKAG